MGRKGRTTPTPPKSRSAPQRRTAGFDRLVWGVLLLGVLLRIAYHPVLKRSPDEFTYTILGQLVMQNGPGYIPRLVQSINQSPEAEHFAWPQRVGYTLIVAGTMAVVGKGTVEVVADVSLVASLLTLLLVGWWGRVAFDRWTAATALLFVATSPIDLAISRRAWQEAVLGLLLLMMAFACARAWVQPARARWTALFLGAGVVAMLVKESAWPVYGAGVVLLTVLAWRARSAASPRAGVRLGLGVLGMVVAVGAIVVACGGPTEAMATWRTAQIVNVPNEYMRRYQSGSVLYYVAGLGLLQPLMFVVALAGAIAVTLRPAWITARAEDRASAPSLWVSALLVLGLGALAVLHSQKNLRFVSPLLAPSAFLAAWALRSMAAGLASRLAQDRRRWVWIGLTVLLIGSSILDVARFHEYFIRRQIPDLATPWFFETPNTPHSPAGTR